MDITYTQEDYIEGTAPYEEVENCETPFAKEQKIAQLTRHAKSVKVNNFLTLYKTYVKTLKMYSGNYVENASNFEGQDFELNTGEWTADDYGITRPGREGAVECACPHPIMPVLRLTNIDTGIEKIELKYRRGGIWRSTVCDRKQIASQNLIVGLADHGIAVTSENARCLVRFLHDVENLNYDRIPERKSVSRLGWVGEDGFSPYVEGLVFDGENNFRTFFDSVKERGSFELWMDVVKGVRAGSNIVPKIILAASFASVLVEPCSGLPFFVHLWGGTETGKTVGLMLAASVWANPEMGKFIHTFNSTAVAQELSAGFVNSLPLILDELQIVKDRKDFDQMIYQLSEGVGKSRGQKTGGLQKTGTWNNCIITSGEQPISSGSSGGGAVNRIIEISCEERKLFENPAGLVKAIKQNHGHAGRRFVELMNDPEIIKNAQYVQQTFYKEINKQSTEKQALAASLILTADFLANEYLFHDGRCISFEELQQFLSTKEDVSAERRAYEWLLDWIAQNKGKFLSPNYEPVNECWGSIFQGQICVIKNVFNKACSENGFNPVSFSAWLKRQGLTETDQGRNDKLKRLNGSRCRCIILHDEVEFEEVQEKIPFDEPVR